MCACMHMFAHVCACAHSYPCFSLWQFFGTVLHCDWYKWCRELHWFFLTTEMNNIPMHAYTIYTQTHIHAYIIMHSWMHSCTHMHTYACMHTHTHTCTHPCSHTHSHALMHALTYTRFQLVMHVKNSMQNYSVLNDYPILWLVYHPKRQNDKRKKNLVYQIT